MSWNDPSDTTISHQYRYLSRDPDAANPEWGDFGAWTAVTGTSNMGTITADVTGLTAGNNYLFQLRSMKSGAHSWPANANYTSVAYGTPGNDRLTGDLSKDYMTGLAGDDHLVGSGGADKLEGGDGNDTLSYASSNAAVTVNFQSNSVSGGHAAGDTLSGIEIVVGSAHNDTLTGTIAHGTVLEGGAGAETLRPGGTGIEQSLSTVVSYASSPSGVTVNLATSTASGGHAEGDTLSNIVSLTGSAHDDTLTGSNHGNYIEGGPGNDTLEGGHTPAPTTDSISSPALETTQSTTTKRRTISTSASTTSRKSETAPPSGR